MTKKDQSNLVKIVYFDEQAAIDALQVVDGGSALETLSKTLKEMLDVRKTPLSKVR